MRVQGDAQAIEAGEGGPVAHLICHSLSRADRDCRAQLGACVTTARWKGLHSGPLWSIAERYGRTTILKPHQYSSYSYHVYQVIIV